VFFGTFISCADRGRRRAIPIASHDKHLYRPARMGQSAYVDDLCVATNAVAQMQAQMDKIMAFEQWAHLEANVFKRALTAALHHNGRNINEDKHTLNRIVQRLSYRGGMIPVRGENEPYQYLSVMITASLNWRHQRTEMTNRVAESSRRLIGSWATKAQQARSMMEVADAHVRYGMVAAPYSKPDIMTLMTGIHYSMKKALGLPVNTPSAQLYNPVEAFGVGLLDAREEYHRKLVQSLDQTLKDKGRIGNLIGGLVRWHHEHGIQAGSWLSMGPVARKQTTAWEAGLELGGAVKQRPGVLRDLKGKRVDNGSGWGIQLTLRESDATPLIELGVLTIFHHHAPRYGIDGSRWVQEKIPQGEGQARLVLNEGEGGPVCGDSGRQQAGTTGRGRKAHPPRTNPLKRSWRAHENGPDDADHTTREVTLRGPRKKTKARKQHAASPVPAPTDQEEEQAVRLHKCRAVGGHRQYLVEWADTWTDGHQVKRQPHHKIGTTPKKGGHREEIERVVKDRQTDQGITEYKVKWMKTWEPAAYLIPKSGGTSPLIVEFHQEKMASGNMEGWKQNEEGDKSTNRTRQPCTTRRHTSNSTDYSR